AFLASDRSVSGFSESQNGMAQRLSRGDKLLAYIKGLSRWAAVFEILDGPCVDRAPLFLAENDPYVVRFRVKPIAALSLEQAIPIRDDEVFSTLSFTRGKEKGYWLGPLRRSLQHIDDADGRFLENLLIQQSKNPKPYPL